MSPSKRIAGLAGPTLIALTVSETVNLGIWKTNDPRVTYLNGLLLFIGGLAIVRAHNVWVRAWPVLVARARNSRQTDEGTSALQGS